MSDELTRLAEAMLPLFDLGRYYDSRPADNRSSVEALAAIEAGREAGESVVLDRRLNDRRLGDGAVSLDQAMAMLLRIRDLPFEFADVEPEDVDRLLARRPSQLAVLDRVSVSRLADRYALAQLALITPRTARAERQRDFIPSWRDTGIGALLRQLDPQSSPDRKDPRICQDCGDPGVYRISPKT